MPSVSPLEAYYNGFYRELAVLDEQGNSFSKIAALLPSLPEGARILDIGCGHGSVSEELVKRGYEVVGLEANDEALESLKKKGFIAVKGDMGSSIDLPPHFDLVLLLDVLEHTFNPLSLLEEAVRLLKPNGQVIISVPLYFDLLDRLRILFTGSIVSYDNRCYGDELYRRFRSYNYDHIRFFRPADIFELCKAAGLTLEETKYLPMGVYGWLAPIVRLFANRYTVALRPQLLAHGMRLRARK